MNKKGNINQLFPAVLALVLVGALLTVGLLIITGFQNTSYVAGTAGSSYLGESVSPNTTGVALVATGTQRNIACAVTNAYNGTGGMTINAGNFTTIAPCSIANLTTEFGKAAWLVNYTTTYDAPSTTTNALGSTITAMASLASTWLPIIVVVVAAGLVLGILLGAFAGKRK